MKQKNRICSDFPILRTIFFWWVPFSFIIHCYQESKLETYFITTVPSVIMYYLARVLMHEARNSGGTHSDLFAGASLICGLISLIYYLVRIYKNVND